MKLLVSNRGRPALRAAFFLALAVFCAGLSMAQNQDLAALSRTVRQLMARPRGGGTLAGVGEPGRGGCGGGLDCTPAPSARTAAPPASARSRLCLGAARRRRAV